MKIALCLHGKFDSLTDHSSKGIDGFSHLKSRVFSKCDPDVFIHCWDKEKEETILKLYNPKDLIIEDQIDFSDKTSHLNFLTNPPRKPETILSHFYSVSKSIELACRYDQYDIIIKSRFDIGRINRSTSGPHNKQNPYPVQCITFDPNLNMDLLHMANWQYIDSDGPADMWFYSNQKNMSRLSEIYQFAVESFDLNGRYAKSLSDLNDLPNAIKLYKQFFIARGLWVKKNLLETFYE